jgi:oligopeptide/dipeptide ABC transporter ATP-binding protein
VTFPVGEKQMITPVDDVSLQIVERETLGLVGESGCGKTTLGRAVLQLIRPTGGSVQFHGRDLMQLSGGALRAMRREMQIIFQDPRGSLDPRMRIRDIVEEPLRVHGLGNAGERHARARAMLAEVGLDASYDRRRPSELSGGQQQRVGIARALVTHPRLVVCDEPVSSLDVSIQAQVINLLRDLQERHGLAYLFIAHNLAVVRALSDRIGVMYLGQIVELAPTRGLFDRPLHPYTQGLIAAVLSPDTSARAQLDAASTLAAGDVPSVVNPPSGCRYHTRCPFAREVCTQERPQLEEGEPGHWVACHRWREIQATGAGPRVAQTASHERAVAGTEPG